jgi:hypothetical protein
MVHSGAANRHHGEGLGPHQPGEIRPDRVSDIIRREMSIVAHAWNVLSPYSSNPLAS